MKNAKIYSTIDYKVRAKIMEQCNDSPPYFQNQQCHQSPIAEDYTWTTDDTKLLLADMFQMQQVQ